MSTFSENRKAYFNYEVLEKLEAGIELFGFEVKAVKHGKAVLDGARVIVRGNEVYVVGMQIAPYQQNNTPLDYDPVRTRKLLITKKEIGRLYDTESTKGLTIIGLSLYSKGPKVKLELGIVKGKKKFDKRESIKKRDVERDLRRTLKT